MTTEDRFNPKVPVPGEAYDPSKTYLGIPAVGVDGIDPNKLIIMGHGEIVRDGSGLKLKVIPAEGYTMEPDGLLKPVSRHVCEGVCGTMKRIKSRNQHFALSQLLCNGEVGEWVKVYTMQRATEDMKGVTLGKCFVDLKRRGYVRLKRRKGVVTHVTITEAGKHYLAATGWYHGE